MRHDHAGADDPAALDRPGMTDLGEATMTILPARLLPALLEHVFVLTSRRGWASRRGGGEAADVSVAPKLEVQAAPKSGEFRVPGPTIPEEAS